MFSKTPQLYYTIPELYRIVGKSSIIQDRLPIEILFVTEISASVADIFDLTTYKQQSVKITYVPLKFVHSSGKITEYYVIKGNEHIFENIGK